MYIIIKSNIALVDIHTSLSIASVNTISYPVPQPLSEPSQCSPVTGFLLFSVPSDAGAFVSRFLTSELQSEFSEDSSCDWSQPACYQHLTDTVSDKR